VTADPTVGEVVFDVPRSGGKTEERALRRDKPTVRVQTLLGAHEQTIYV